MIELRDKRHKLKAMWDKEGNAIIIRDHGRDIMFTLYPDDGRYDVDEKPAKIA